MNATPKTYRQIFDDAANGLETYDSIRAGVEYLDDSLPFCKLQEQVKEVFPVIQRRSKSGLREWMIAQACENLASWQRTRPGFTS